MQGWSWVAAAAVACLAGCVVSTPACAQARAADGLPQLVVEDTWRTSRNPESWGVTIVTQLSLERLEMLRHQCEAWPDGTAAVVYVPLAPASSFESVDGAEEWRTDARDVQKGVARPDRGLPVSGASGRATGAPPPAEDWRVVSHDSPALNGTTMSAARALLTRLHADMERSVVFSEPDAWGVPRRSGGCALDLQLATARYDSPLAAGLYPYNSVRNRALALSRGEALFLLDVDFVPSSHLPAEWADASARRELLAAAAAGTAVVVPALEPAPALGLAGGRALALVSASRGKPWALQALRRGLLRGFQLTQYPPGHGPTDYFRWSTAAAPYHVSHQQGYEPYVIVHRARVPWYDERFRGYGRDKIVHLAHLASLRDSRLAVHPLGFVVHLPHNKTRTFQLTKDTGQWDRVTRVYKRVLRDIAARRYVPGVTSPIRCAARGGAQAGA